MSRKYERMKNELCNVKNSIAKMCFNVAINGFLMTHKNEF